MFKIIFNVRLNEEKKFRFLLRKKCFEKIILITNERTNAKQRVKQIS